MRLTDVRLGQGHFANGKKEGPGISTRLKDGAVRRGDWANNMPL